MRTGYEMQLAHRVGKLYAATVDQPAVVKKVTDKQVVVELEDGTVKSTVIGREFGTVTGKTVAHTLVTDVKEGQKLPAGTVYAWNSGFFERTLLAPTQVAFKGQMLARTVLVETQQTIEDASVISDYVQNKQVYDKTVIRDINIRFEESISEMVSLGDKLDSEDRLCILSAGDNAADDDIFSDRSKAIFDKLSTSTPKADFSGVVERIEVYYTGDIEDMTPELQSITLAANKRLMQMRKAEGKTVVTGEIEPGTRIGKTELGVDEVLIRIYLTKEVKVGIGDKGVFGNQMKTIYSGKMLGINKTESGKEIHAKFSYLSINNRIVGSAEAIGGMCTLLPIISRMVADYGE